MGMEYTPCRNGMEYAPWIWEWNMHGMVMIMLEE